MQKEIGPTGKYPEGKAMRDGDDGEVQVAIYNKDNKLFIDFGTNLSWVGMKKNQATDLIKVLQIKVAELKD